MENQLTLFTLLSNEQEIEKNRKLDNLITQQNTNESLVKLKKQILLEAGFVEGLDFEVRCGRVMKNITFSIGHSYQNNRLEFNENISMFEGNCFLIKKSYDEKLNKVVTNSISFELYKGKLNCYQLQNYNSRMLKPTTMLSKLKLSNESAEYDYTRANKERSVLESLLDKYSTLYPEATVTEGSSTSKLGRNNYITYKIINITFKSGSYIKLRPGSKVGDEYLSEIKDKITTSMTLSEKLEYFNKQ